MLAWQAHGRRIVQISYSPDGRRLATFDSGGTDVAVWTTPGGNREQVIRAAGDSANAVAFSPDGSQLAVAFVGEIVVHDLASGRVAARWTLIDQFVRSLTFGPDGSTLLAAGVGPTAVGWLWDARDGTLRHELRKQPFVESGWACLADGRTVLWTDDPILERSLRYCALSDVVTGNRLTALTPSDRTKAVSVAAAAPRVAIASEESVAVWDLSGLSTPHRPRSAWRDVHRRLIGLPAGGGAANLNPMVRLLPPDEWFNLAALDRTGRRALTVSDDWRVSLWNVPRARRFFGAQETSTPVATWDWQIDQICAIAFASDGLTAAAGSDTGRVVIWDLDA
ncbi:MAG: hypothetical protein U0746_03555 [Gemmataceae bacterium]